MHRRGFIAGLGVITVTGCTGIEAVDSIIDSSTSGVIHDIERSEDDKQLTVTFADEHDADFVALIHEYDEETVLYSADAPRFSGPIEIPFMAAVACDSGDYPTNTFEVVAGSGTTVFGLVEDILGRATVDVTDEWLAQAKEYEPEYPTCFEMTFS